MPVLQLLFEQPVDLGRTVAVLGAKPIVSADVRQRKSPSHSMPDTVRRELTIMTARQ